MLFQGIEVGTDGQLARCYSCSSRCSCAHVWWSARAQSAIISTLVSRHTLLKQSHHWSQANWCHYARASRRCFCEHFICDRYQSAPQFATQSRNLTYGQTAENAV